MPTLTSNVNKATYLIKVHTARQQAFATFQMPVTLADNSAHSKTTPEAKWALIKDKAHATLFTARQHPKRNGLPSKTVKAQKPRSQDLTSYRKMRDPGNEVEAHGKWQWHHSPLRNSSGGLNPCRWMVQNSRSQTALWRRSPLSNAIKMYCVLFKCFR